MVDIFAVPPGCNTIAWGVLCAAMLAALTFAPNRDIADWINEAASGIKDLCVYKTLHTYPEPNELVQLLNIFSPEVVFLELEQVEQALETVREIRSGHPKAAIIAFGKHQAATVESRATEAGVNEILPAPCPSDTFQQAVLRAVEGRRAEMVDNVLAFVPAKAGSGATTTLLNLAALLGGEWQKRVLVMEADMQSGVLAHLLGLDPEQSVVDALENSRWLNEGVWLRLVSRALGFDILPMPGVKQHPMVSRWEYQRVLTFARPRYDLVFADLPEQVDDATIGIVTQASTIYVVCTPEKASLYLARRRIDELEAREIPKRRIQIVLNRNWEKGVDYRPTEAFLGREIAIFLGNDDSRFKSASPEALVAPLLSELGQGMHSFARMLAGGPPPPKPPLPEPKPGWRNLLKNRVVPH